MKKILTSIFMMVLCTFVFAQNVLIINGTVTNTEGDVLENAYLGLSVESFDEPFLTQTDDQGFFEFEIDLDENTTQGCFELYLIDCTLEPIIESDCFDPGNTSFNYNFVYCENGSDECHSIIFTEVLDSSIVLSTLDFGEAPYTYLWSDGSTGATVSLPLDATGVYCVTVTDNSGCVVEACVDLTPPDLCFVHIYQEYDGIISSALFAEGYGQTLELEYEWSTGETGPMINIFVSGEYCVTMTDGLGCESTDCGYFEVDTINNFDCFSYIYSSYDANDSLEILNVESFGVAPFTYVWTFGDSVISTSNSITPAETGVYCVIVTDAEGCENTSCYDYFEWEECGVWLSCDPTEQGVQLWAFGYGAEPIEYSWSNGETGQEIIVTESGEYCVTIVDAEGCTSSTCLDVDANVSECFAPIEVEYFGDYAELTVNPINDGEYEFYWNTGESTQTITVEMTENYCVEVIEVETGCTFSTCVTVNIGGQEECWGWIEAEYSADSSAVLSVFIVNTNSDSLDYNFEWSTGETTETIQVTEEGEYCVIVSGPFNCVFEVCTEVVFWNFPWQNSIFGVVYEVESGEPLDALVDIYTLLDDGTIELYSEGNETLDGGFFVVDNVVHGNYIALAVTEEEGFVPTYGYNTTSWEDATIHEVGDFTSVTPLEIAMIPITSLQGEGTIEGSVYSENIVSKGEQSTTRNGTPIEDANVMLMHSDIPVGQVFTNEEGQFRFTGLPFGTYEVVLEIPGQPRKVIEVVLSEDNPNDAGLEFETEDTTTSTTNISVLSSLTLSPNPTSNILVVESYFKEASDLVYRVIDLDGRIVESSTAKAAVGENEFRIDVSSIKSGVYNLVLQTQEELVTKRFIKL